MHIYASSGLWKSSKRSGWKFLVDEVKGGRLLTLDTSKTFDNLRVMVCEDFGIDVNMVNIELIKGGRLLTLDTSKTFDNLRVMVCEDFGIDVNMVNIELSYLSSDLVIGIDSAPVFITNDRQLKIFLTYVKNKASTRLCVCIRFRAETSNIKVDLNLNEEATESPNSQEEPMSFEVSEEDVVVDESDDDCNREKDMINGKQQWKYVQ
ncbi:hypothetical protein F2Q69_00037290 [Brassica cretica]|uniref:Uncharacterized protein n=1 Tax=Brassica cretica TaxID=69181 RepID=A0A8S9SF79_BRACR|nr:hypothetical protein F2Q69_00037290 [Brassica cretica]